LSNRVQYRYACVNSVLSSQCCVTTGVLQGSVLSPLLFLLFINEVCCAINSVFTKLFADDIKVYIDVTVKLVLISNRLLDWAKT